MKTKIIIFVIAMMSINSFAEDKKDPCKIWSETTGIYVCDIGSHVIFSQKNQPMVLIAKAPLQQPSPQPKKEVKSK
jgi:hypothetical protein